MSACFVSPGRVQAQEKPNIIFLYADDLGYADISFNRIKRVAQAFPAGHDYHISHNFARTPRIDSIFNAGIVLDNHLTHMVCSPSRAGFMTGRHYTEVGSSARVGAQIDGTVPNIAKNFQNNGYVTGCFGKWHNSRGIDDGGNDEVGSVRVPEFGFTEWAGYYGGGQDYFFRSTDEGWYEGEETTSGKDDTSGKYDAVENKDGMYTTYMLQDYATDFIDRHKDDNFFLYVPWTAVHAPHHVTRADLEDMCNYFDDTDDEGNYTGYVNYGDFPGKDNLSHLSWDSVSKIWDSNHEKQIMDYDYLRFTKGEFNKTNISKDYPGFDYLVHFTMAYAMDKAVGEILDKVVNAGLSDNTIIVFSSDNGSNNGDNGPFYGKKLTGWEGGHHVPTAIWWPGEVDASTVELHKYPYMTQYLDWYPTLVAAAGIPLDSEADLDGINIWENLKTGLPARRFSDSKKSFLTYDYYRNWNVIRNDDYVLHYNQLQGADEYVQLFDRGVESSEDPAADGNVAEEPGYADVLAGMKKQIDDWYASGDVSTRFMKIPDEFHHFHNAVAAPVGEVIEIRIEQTANLDPAKEGLYMGFASLDFPGTKKATDYIKPSDYIQYDICVAPDSEQVEGYVVSPTNLEISSTNGPHLRHNTGIGLEGIPLAKQVLPRGEWVRCVAGVGDATPSNGRYIYLGFLSEEAGTYHVYLDNITICKSNGDKEQDVPVRTLDETNVAYFCASEQRTIYSSFAEIKREITDLKYQNPSFGTLSTPPHQPQGTITFDSPEGNPTFQVGESIPVGVTATGDEIQRVVVLRKLISQPDSAYGNTERDFSWPYAWNLEPLPAGSYRLKGVSYDGANNIIAEGYTNFIVQADTYSLTVTSGSPAGTTTHAPGAVVDILADVALEEMVFNGWTGDTGDVVDLGARSTTIKMNANASIRATYTVTSNEAPVIDSLIAPATVQLGDEFALTVTATDPEGDSMNFSWTQVGGPGTVTFGNANAPTTDAGFSVAGNYELEVTVSDGRQSAKRSVVVEVTGLPDGVTIVRFITPENNQDVASDFQVKVSASNSEGINEVRLFSQPDGATTWDPIGVLTTGPYQWDVSLDVEASYNLMATAFPSIGKPERAIIGIKVVGDSNIAPTVSFSTPSSDITDHKKGSQLSITATASDDDGEIAKLELSLDNDIIETLEGDLGTYEFSSLVLDKEGLHIVELIATDNFGATSTAAVRHITVIPDAAGAPAPARRDDGDGCGCSTTEGTNGTVWLIALLILGMVIRQGYVTKLQ